MARDYDISPGRAYEMIRAQPGFDCNSNLEVRCAIRAEFKYAKTYYILTDTHHKYKYEGVSRTSFGHDLRYGIYNKTITTVHRINKNQISNIYDCLNFSCPFCDGKKFLTTKYNQNYQITQTDRKFVCDDCWKYGLRIFQQQLGRLNSLAKLLGKGEISDEEYRRIKEYPASGFGRSADGRYLKIGSARAVDAGAKYHRHIEDRSRGTGDADRSVFSGAFATAIEISRRRRVIDGYSDTPAGCVQ